MPIHCATRSLPKAIANGSYPVMRIPILLLLITAIFSLCIDTYIYIVLKKRLRSNAPARIQLVTALILYVILIVGLSLPIRSGNSDLFVVKMWVLFGYMTFIFGKLTFVIFDLLASIPKFFGRRRIRIITFVGGCMGVVLFLAMWWGALINRFNVDLIEIELPVQSLPEEFDNYRIVQISDLHVGTFGSDTAYVSRLVKYINSLEPDAVFFTGDIVNRTSAELIPFVETLSKIESRDGVFSILGNHDYGDYFDWESDKAKVAALDSLIAMQKSMGWNLLLNEHRFIRHGGDSIAVIGVENVGDPPFKVYGDLKASYPDLSDNVTKILLTHNPAHWQMEIADNDKANVALTLAGHTHAMQIELFGWSPAVWRYPTWGGMYKDKSGRHPLYVNIGVGTVGMPMRLGATPEVTLFTLTRDS